MNWLVLTRQEQVALLFLTGTLLMGCVVLIADAWRQDGLPDFHVIRGAVAQPVMEEQSAAQMEGVAGTAQVAGATSQAEDGLSEGSGPQVDGKIGVNSADLMAWETLPGIGPHTAAAIVEYRRQHGRFDSIDELIQVRGIGERTVTRLRPRLRLD